MCRQEENKKIKKFWCLPFNLIKCFEKFFEKGGSEPILSIVHLQNSNGSFVINGDGGR